ncbi:MAG: sulfur carrier protein ThiS [Sulfurovum sp.]|nr:sulfur carrier protein ThiS [Sulfurovum sp.]
MIEISINGKKEKLDKSICIAEMLKKFKFDDQFSGVAINMEFVSKKLYSQIIIRDGDQIEVLAPICGG